MLKLSGRIRASAALKQAYYKKLLKLIEDMSNSADWWLGAAYKKQLPLIAAQDSASGDIHDELQKLIKQWSKKYDGMASDIAKWFVSENAKHSNRNLQSLLAQAGYTVNIKLTPHQRDKLSALVLENIHLIKSIPGRYFTQLNTAAMESITRGRDLAYLRDEIMKCKKVCKNRAVLIARDQNNKATSIITHMKYEELGITQAIWKHNSGGKNPRVEHLKADNKIYDIHKGYYMEKAGKHVLPGEEINCGCTSMPIIPALSDSQSI